MWPAVWTSTSALPRCSSFSSFSGTAWWEWSLQRTAQRYTRTHLGFQLTIINTLIITVFLKYQSWAKQAVKAKLGLRAALDHNSAPSDRLWLLVWFLMFKYLLAQCESALWCDLSLLYCAHLQSWGPFLLFTGQGAPRRHLRRLISY